MGETSDIKDLWREFNRIKLLSQKKLLKKPDFRETVAQYRCLADSLEESEQFDQSALCHQEIAEFYAKAGNCFMARRHLVKAAKLYYSTQLLIQRTNSECASGFGTLMEQCYLKVIHGLLKSSKTHPNYFSIVGLIHFELAIQMHSIKEPLKSLIYSKRANRFVQGDLSIQIQIVEHLCDLVLAVGNEHSVELLSEVDSIWVSLPKKEEMRRRLLALEARIILLHLKQSKAEIYSIDASSNSPLKKHFLSTYNCNWQDNDRKSVTTKKEFFLFSQFISAVKNDNYLEASQIHAIGMAKLLDSKGNESCAELIDSLNFNQMDNRKIDDILASKELSELEKRSKLFDLLNNFSRLVDTQCIENL